MLCLCVTSIPGEARWAHESSDTSPLPHKAPGEAPRPHKFLGRCPQARSHSRKHPKDEAPLLHCWNHCAISRLMAQWFQQNNHTSVSRVRIRLGAKTR